MNQAVVIWIWLCAYLNCAGWLLSAIHQLNAVGYTVVLAVGFGAFLLWKICDKGPNQLRQPFNPFRKLLCRFQQPFPLAFLALAVLAFLGGAIHAPNNYDALAYRVPRVLHWLAAGQWQWVHTPFPRLNNRACGIEWLSAPLLALFKTDRLLFLINIMPFLLLPGLTFSVLSRLGVRRRVAWHWMWIAPAGYCFLIQAGSIANDAFAAPFALAAIDFALRAKISQRPRDFFTSILAAALLTGAKAGNLVLLLPWAIALLPSLKIFLHRPLATAIVCVAAIFASFLPSAILNYHYCRDWSGRSLEGDQPHGAIVLRTAASFALLAVQNLSPPVFPEADRWNQFVQKKIPPDLSLRLQQAFTEPGVSQFLAPQMQIEENAGLGFGVTLLLLASVIAVIVPGGRALLLIPLPSAGALWRLGIVIAPWVSTFALVSQSEVSAIARILTPFYLLLLPWLLLPPGHEQLIKKFWWRAAAFVVFAMAAGLLIISPARPLFPVGRLLDQLSTSHSKLATRTAEVYTVYRDRNHAFQPVLEVLPPGLKTLGFITYDDPETSLWQPFGSRTIFHVSPGDRPNYLKTNGVQFILARGDLFGNRFPNYDVWLKSMNAQTVQTLHLNVRAETGPGDWYLIKLN